MTNLLESNKNSFKNVLWPMFELLIHKKQVLKHDDWMAFVMLTESRIIESPQQFLGNDLPDRSIIVQAIKEIFIEFLEAEGVEV